MTILPERAKERRVFRNDAVEHHFRFLFKTSVVSITEILLLSSILELDFLKVMRYIP
jgi:hypothetical protein